MDSCHKKSTLIALVFIAIFFLAFVAPPTEEVMSSQIRDVKPNANFASTANPKAIRQAYTYGSPYSGSYESTYYKDGTCHISNPSTYASPTLSTSNTYPAYGWNDAGSGSIPWVSTTNIYTVNTVYATATCTGGTNVLSQWLDSSHYGFSLPSGSTIKGFKVSVYGHCTIAGDEFKQAGFCMIKGGVRVGSTNGSFSFIASDAWYTYGGPTSLFGTTWTEAEVESVDFGVGLQGKFYTSTYTAYVDAFYIIVYYTVLYYRTNYYYEFWYVSSPRFNVTGLGWRFYGYSDAPSGVSIYQWNWLTSAWVDSGLDIPSSNGWQNASALTINSYMNATGFMRMSFDKSGLDSSFQIFVDYVYWSANYSSTIVQTTTYITPITEPTYINGSTHSGTYHNTEASDNIYQIGEGGSKSYYTYSSDKDEYPSSESERDMVESNDLSWSSPTSIYSDDAAYASVQMPSGWVTRYSHYLVGSNFGFSIPAGAEILSIVISYERYSNYNSANYYVQTFRCYLGATTTEIKGDNMADSSTKWATSPEWFTSTNTTHGYSWTAAEINSVGFSLHIGAKLTNAYGSGTIPTGYIDVYKVSVWYREIHFTYEYDASYLFRFTASDTTTIQSINWLVEGNKTESQAATIYIWNYLTSEWDSTGCTLSTVESSQNGTVDISKYISVTGYMKTRIFQTGCSVQNYIYLDRLMWTVVWLETPEDNTPPQSPELFYPSPNQQIMYDNPLFCWNDSIDASGIAYYRIVLSEQSDFSDIRFNETTTKTWYKHYTNLPCSIFYWKIKAVDSAGNIGDYSSSRTFYSTADPEVYISYYDYDGEGVPFSSVKSYINGSRITNPYVSYPVMNTYINLTVTDYFGNQLFQDWYNITYTPYYIDEQIQLCSVTLSAYDLTYCTITSSGMNKNVSFSDSITIKLKPGNYSFVGTAWNGAISFDVDKTITYTANRGIKLCNVPLIINSITTSQSENQFAVSASANKQINIRINDNGTLVYPMTWAYSIMMTKATTYGLHNLTIIIFDADGYSYNATDSYFVDKLLVYFELFSTFDGAGLDWNLVKWYVNGTRIYTVEYWISGNILNVTLTDYFDTVIYANNLTYSPVISIGVGFCEYTIYNKGANLIDIVIAKGGMNQTVSIGADSSLTMRMINGTYNFVAYGYRDAESRVQFDERTVAINHKGSTIFLDSAHQTGGDGGGGPFAFAIASIPSVIVAMSLFTGATGIYNMYTTKKTRESQERIEETKKKEEKKKRESSADERDEEYRSSADDRKEYE